MTTTEQTASCKVESSCARDHAKMVDVGLLVVRVALALPLIYHGAGIALGLFDGPGLSGFAAFTHFPLPVAAMVGWGELLGGLGVLFGVLTRLAAAGTGVIMLGAVLLVHLSKGYSLQHGGFEYALTLALLSFAILLAGGGKFSLAALLVPKRKAG